MNNFRVDRIHRDAENPPAGMNSILYIGDSFGHAEHVYLAAEPGRTPWGKRDPEYELALSKWDESKRDYLIVRRRGV